MKITKLPLRQGLKEYILEREFINTQQLLNDSTPKEESPRKKRKFSFADVNEDEIPVAPILPNIANLFTTISQDKEYDDFDKENQPRINTGFTTGSGKKIEKPSELKIKEAKALLATPNSNGDTSNGPNKENAIPRINSGFMTAGGNKVAKPIDERRIKVASDLLTISKNTGFMTASGKQVEKPSDAKIKEAAAFLLPDTPLVDTGFKTGSGIKVDKPSAEKLKSAATFLSPSQSISTTSGFITGSGNATIKPKDSKIKEAAQFLDQPIIKSTSGFKTAGGKAVKKPSADKIKAAESLLINPLINISTSVVLKTNDTNKHDLSLLQSPKNTGFLTASGKSVTKPAASKLKEAKELISTPVKPMPIIRQQMTPATPMKSNNIPVLFRTPSASNKSFNSLLSPCPDVTDFFSFSSKSLIQALPLISFNLLSNLPIFPCNPSNLSIPCIPIIPSLLNAILTKLHTFPKTLHLSLSWLNNQFLLQSWFLLSHNLPSSTTYDQSTLFMAYLLKCIYSTYIAESSNSSCSILKDMVEGDASPAISMILMVICQINDNLVIVSDGFYQIEAQTQFKYNFKSGQHIYTSHCTMTGNPVDILDNKFRILQLSSNATKLAIPTSKLGISKPMRCSISSILKLGGLVPMIKVIIERKYKLQFYDQQQHKTINERGYEKRIDDLQQNGIPSDEEPPQFSRSILLRISEYPDLKVNKGLGSTMLQIWHPNDDLIAELKEGMCLTVTNIQPNGQFMKTTKQSQIIANKGDNEIVKASLYTERVFTSVQDIYFDRCGEFDILLKIGKITEAYLMGMDENKQIIAIFINGGDMDCRIGLNMVIQFKNLKYHREINGIVESWYLGYSGSKIVTAVDFKDMDAEEEIKAKDWARYQNLQQLIGQSISLSVFIAASATVAGMNFLSLINAQIQLSCDKRRAPVTAVDSSNVRITAKGATTPHVIFFESPLAGLDKCKIEILKDGDFDLKLIGELSSKAEGQLSQPIKMLACNNQGTVNIPAIDLTVDRSFDTSKQTCQSLGDPHISCFNKGFGTYSHFGTGDFWLARTDLWDVQVHHEKCYGNAACNTKVGVRYMDSVWVADAKTPSFKCNSPNGCKDYKMIVQENPGGRTIGKLPGNIEISTSNMNGIGLNVYLTVPGQETIGASLCNPGKKITSTISDKTFSITGTSYFGGPVTVTRPNIPDIPVGFMGCKLPTSCDNVFPPAASPSPNTGISGGAATPTPNPSPSPSAAVNGGNSTTSPTPSTAVTGGNAVATPSPSTAVTGGNIVATPSPSTALTGDSATTTPAPLTNATLPNGPSGVDILTGFKLGTPSANYVPPPANLQLVPQIAIDISKATVTPISRVESSNATASPPAPATPLNSTDTSDTLAKCKSGLPMDHITILSKEEQDFHLDCCAKDLKITPLAIENAKQAILTSLERTTADNIKTSNDADLVAKSKTIQQNLGLGGAPCNCGSNGFCSAFGCECKSGFMGTDCSQTLVVPDEVKQLADSRDQALTQAIDNPKGSGTAPVVESMGSPEYAKPTTYSSSSFLQMSLMFLAIHLIE